jgi:hypothetical protein
MTTVEAFQLILVAVTTLLSTALIVVFNGNGSGFIRISPLIVALYSNGGVLHEEEALIVAFYSNGRVFDRMAVCNPTFELDCIWNILLHP